MGQEGQLDVVLVLVSVADYQGVLVDIRGEYGVEFGLRPGFQSDVEFFAVADDFLHDGAHLVYLDGVNHEVLSGVFIFFGSLAETAENLFHPVVEDVGEAQQYRGRYILELQFVKNFPKVDRSNFRTGSDGDVSLVVDRKILPAPASDIIQLGTVFNSPFSHFSR